MRKSFETLFLVTSFKYEEEKNEVNFVIVSNLIILYDKKCAVEKYTYHLTFFVVMAIYLSVQRVRGERKIRGPFAFSVEMDF